jgi:PAS domain S-box-containing protein
MSEVELLRRQLEREQQARLDAERLLESKSNELYAANADLQRQADLNRANVKFLNAVLDQMPVGLCLSQLTGELKMANPVARDMLELNPKHVTQANMRQFFPKLVIEKMQAGHPFKVDMLRPDGKLVPAEVVVSPLFQGTTHSLIWLVTDITERRRAEEKQRKLEGELRQAQKMESLGVLSAGIAHEINTPLQFARDNINFIQDAFKSFHDAFDDVKQHLDTTIVDEAWQKFDLEFHLAESPKAIADTMEGLNRVGEIVRAIKEFAHPSGTTLQANDLNKMIQNAVMVTRNNWKYVAEVETELATDLPMVECCGGEIGQVLLNLIGNAADALAEHQSGRKGKITIATRMQDQTVEIIVADDGPGIPPQILPRIFDPFFTTKEPGKGSGQGLAICHTIITRSHKGSITAHPNAPKGALFRILLPVRTVQQAA